MYVVAATDITERRRGTAFVMHVHRENIQVSEQIFAIIAQQANHHLEQDLQAAMLAVSEKSV